MGYDRAEIIHRLRYQPLSGFRNEYAYTNFGYSEACYAAARAIGQEWSELAAEKLFKPLGMKSTSYRFADYDRAPNKALLHLRVDGKWIAKNTRQPDAQAPAGGVSSTLTDISKWLALLINGGNEVSSGSFFSAETCKGPEHDNEIFTGAPTLPSASFTA